VVACTGFRLSVMGDIPFAVDGKAVNWHDTVNYRGMMFTGVPNLVWVMGYFRASWTLRVDMLGDFVCKLLNHMDARGAKRIDVALRPEDEGWSLGRGSSATTSIPAISCADWMSAARGRQAGMAAQSGLLGRTRGNPGDRSGRHGIRL
jgi:cation diffusion facilitator CzcD-associated flavoprotein CzcO